MLEHHGREQVVRGIGRTELLSTFQKSRTCPKRRIVQRNDPRTAVQNTGVESSSAADWDMREVTRSMIAS